MPIDKVGVNLFYLPKKRLAFEFIIFYGKEVAFINIARLSAKDTNAS